MAINKSVGFVGGGRAARIFVRGWARAGTLPERIVASDPSKDALAQLRNVCPAVETTSDSRSAAQADVVVLAVHPPVMEQAAAAIRGSLNSRATVLSLAPKCSIARLTGWLDGFARIARTIPNAPSIVGQGFNPTAYGPALDAQDRQDIARLLAPLGRSPEVDEAKLEIYAILTAMGPTYFWPQWYELLELAQTAGLSRQESLEGLSHMVRGALAAMADGQLDAAALQDLIPVKPLAEEEEAICRAYRTKLTHLLAKLRP